MGKEKFSQRKKMSHGENKVSEQKKNVPSPKKISQSKTRKKLKTMINKTI